MRVFRFVPAIALAGSLVGCVAAPSGALVSTEQMTFACIAAVEMETNNSDVIILGSDARGGLRDYTLQVDGTGIWSCLVSPTTGAVTNISILSSDGSNLA